MTMLTWLAKVARASISLRPSLSGMASLSAVIRPITSRLILSGTATVDTRPMMRLTTRSMAVTRGSVW